jgi:hypothetical protein
VIKVFFLVLVACTAAIVIVAFAIHYRVKRHLSEQQEALQTPEMESAPQGPPTDKAP